MKEKGRGKKPTPFFGNVLRTSAECCLLWCLLRSDAWGERGCQIFSALHRKKEKKNDSKSSGNIKRSHAKCSYGPPLSIRRGGELHKHLILIWVEEGWAALFSVRGAGLFHKQSIRWLNEQQICLFGISQRISILTAELPDRRSIRHLWCWIINI